MSSVMVAFGPGLGGFGVGGADSVTLVLAFSATSPLPLTMAAGGGSSATTGGSST